MLHIDRTDFCSIYTVMPLIDRDWPNNKLLSDAVDVLTRHGPLTPSPTLKDCAERICTLANCKRRPKAVPAFDDGTLEASIVKAARSIGAYTFKHTGNRLVLGYKLVHDDAVEFGWMMTVRYVLYDRN